MELPPWYPPLVRLHRIYACEGCRRSVYRSNRTDRKKYCTACAIAAVEKQCRKGRDQESTRPALNIVNLPDQSVGPFQGAA